jgi:hypothetical protein
MLSFRGPRFGQVGHVSRCFINVVSRILCSFLSSNLDILLRRDGVTGKTKPPISYMSGYSYDPIRLDPTYVQTANSIALR